MKRRLPVEDQLPDEEIDSDEIPDVSLSENEPNSDEGAFFDETVEEKRVRAIKEYIAQQKKQNIDDETLTEQFNEEYKENIGTKFIDTNLTFNPEPPERFRIHRSRPTAIALGDNCVFSASKTGEIKRATFEPRAHLDIGTDKYPVLCLAYSKEKNILASGNENGGICLWNAKDGGLIFEFPKHISHSSSVTGLVFQPKTATLFTCSMDGTIHVYDVDIQKQMTKPLYGHQAEVMAIDFCIYPVSGGSDLTVRQWKYQQDKQSVFKGGNLHASIDTLSLFNSRYAVTGSQDGKVCLWDLTKRKPLSVMANVHGPSGWISAVAAFKYHKLCATGGYDGFVRLWKIDIENSKFIEISKINLNGYICQLEFSIDGSFLAAQVSQEQRFGRWLPPIKEARQGVHIIRLIESEARK